MAALPIGFFVVNNILSQPASPRSEGFQLVFDLAWLGLVYGTIDALFLSVVPVLAVWQLFSHLGWTSTWVGKGIAGLVAILASLFVTAAYHLGCPEFRNMQVTGPVLGNGVMSLGYLLANNPIAAVFSHVAMHVAAVLHGPATTLQLPPHY